MPIRPLDPLCRFGDRGRMQFCIAACLFSIHFVGVVMVDRDWVLMNSESSDIMIDLEYMMCLWVYFSLCFND